MNQIVLRNQKSGVEEIIEIKNLRYSEILGHYFNVNDEMEAYKAAYILNRVHANVYVIFDTLFDAWQVGYYD